jgi:hypothetical protein
MGFYFTKILGFNSKIKLVDSPSPPHYALFGRTKVGNLKSCPRVLTLLRGWERCLKLTLQTCVPRNFTGVDWGLSGGRRQVSKHQREEVTSMYSSVVTFVEVARVVVFTKL